MCHIVTYLHDTTCTARKVSSALCSTKRHIAADEHSCYTERAISGHATLFLSPDTASREHDVKRVVVSKPYIAHTSVQTEACGSNGVIMIDIHSQWIAVSLPYALAIALASLLMMLEVGEDEL